jgi:hypothetical protein
MPTRECLHGSYAARHLKANPRAFLLLEPLGLPAIEFIEAPAIYFRMEHLQGSAAGIDLIVMGKIGEPFEGAEQVLVPAGAPDLDVPARHCELNGPNLVSLSPLSAAGITVKPLSARTK